MYSVHGTSADCPSARVHSALLLKTTSYDYLRFTRHNAIIFDNDTKACFDRIIPSLGLMATESLGMPQHATASMLATIKGMHFFIQTAYSFSPGFYTSTATALILGVFQGSGATPCIWKSLRCTLLQAFQSYTTGFQATCPSNTRTSQHTDEAYVDNIDLWLTGTFPSTPSTTVTSSLQRIAQVWECLLFASGGTLAFQKFFYYLFQWQWTAHGFPVMSQTTDSPTTVLQMTSGRSTSPTLIPRVETYTGRHTLGVRLAPDGSFTQELTHQQDQALTWVHNIRAFPLTRDKVYIAYCLILRPSFEYPPPNHMLHQATMPDLTENHYRSFPLQNGDIKQNLQKADICTILLQWLCFCRHMETTGSATPSAPDWAPLSQRSSRKSPMYQYRHTSNTTGIPPSPLSYPYKDTASIAPSLWLTTTWEFLNDINRSVTLSDLWIIPLNRKGDCQIIPTVLSQLFHIPNPLLSKPDLQKFNLCCIYLQVITLSDITTSSGTEINCHFWNSHRSSRKSSLKWPNQICQSSTCWGVWRRILHLLFTDSAKSMRIIPSHCLHRWLPHLKLHQLWPTYMYPTTSQLFTILVGGSTYIIYQCQNWFSYYPKPTNTPSLPPESVSITISRWLPFAVGTPYAKRLTLTQKPIPPNVPTPVPPLDTQDLANTSHNPNVSFPMDR